MVTSSIIISFSILEEQNIEERGYLRARLILINGDFLEVAEYFVITNNVCKTVRYRYQWMDQSQKELRKRWDNVNHFPNLPNFPHHVHIGSEDNVHTSESINILQLLSLLEDELRSKSV
ncbi:MAG: DUF6516 family protein [Snowella sp.]|nr:DUF6516 family protein [Snowella sp.]